MSNQLLLRRRMMMKGSKVVNLWNMASPQMTANVPGYLASSKTIDADGTITYTNNTGNNAARIQFIMPASAMGLVNGKQYTIKVWVLNNELRSEGTCISLIYHAGTGGYTKVYPPSPVSVTFTQANDNEIKVGYLYAEDYSNGSKYSIRVMVAEGNHIDDYVPYTNL